MHENCGLSIAKTAAATAANADRSEEHSPGITIELPTVAGAGSKIPSTCGTSTGHAFSVSYGSGTVSGTEKTGSVRSN